jgi:hypothetical protein
VISARVTDLEPGEGFRLRAPLWKQARRFVRDLSAEEALAVSVHRVDHRTTTMQIDPDVNVDP